ncbi:hypothetical protein RND71_012209 [Anisodus tanguticus]|uniref:Uncharacterized protein n=1 Tax=Anisodus tanguticus TaxID=243964 RepID=A0AAE1SFB3_9SOLA|nr:hypothetical protein RND71_012209 [Anisodus tanguticus]
MWLNSSSIDNEEEEEEEEDDEEEEEETLSLRDLPNNEENYQTKKLESPRRSVTQEVFDFCCFLKNSTMCSADEVFFQGQILPLHHLNSLPSDSHTAGRSPGNIVTIVSILPLQALYVPGTSLGFKTNFILNQVRHPKFDFLRLSTETSLVSIGSRKCAVFFVLA